MFLITINLDRYCGVAVVEDRDAVKKLITGIVWDDDKVSITWKDDPQLNWDGQSVYYGSARITDADGDSGEPYHLEAFPLPIAGDSMIIEMSS